MTRANLTKGPAFDRARGAEGGRARFFRKVDKSGGPDACWPFMLRPRWKYGHSRVSYLGKVWPAHRLSYFFHHGPFDAQLHVLHKCDNPPCVNPAHLYVGTHLDNMRDRSERRRTSLHKAKLTEEDVREVRGLLRSGMKFSEVARRFGVKTNAIYKIATGRTWRHVPGSALAETQAAPGEKK